MSSNNNEEMPKKVLENKLVNRLIIAGELLVSGENQVETDSYFDTENFKFHGPDGFNTDYTGLTNYFESLREAFENRTIKRGIIIVNGDYVSCQTWIEGTFVKEFTQSPVGTLQPNEQHIIFNLINIFRFDKQGRLVEEWVQTDNRSLLRELGAKGR
jgi:predicted ester cyclase